MLISESYCNNLILEFFSPLSQYKCPLYSTVTAQFITVLNSSLIQTILDNFCNSIAIRIARV